MELAVVSSTFAAVGADVGADVRAVVCDAVGDDKVAGPGGVDGRC